MKHFKRLVPVLLAIIVLVMPFTVWAQGDGEETKEFVSADELLTVSYPADWYADEITDLGFPAFAVANSEELLATVLDSTEGEQPAESGQVAAQVLLFPVDILGFLGVELTDEMTNEEIATALIGGMMGQDNTEDAMNIGEAEVVEVGEDLEVVVFSAQDEKQQSEGILAVYEVADGILLLGVGQTFTGEFDDDLQAQFLEVFASVEYTGTAEDLMAALMGGATSSGSDFTPTPTPVNDMGLGDYDFTPTPAP